MGKNKDYPRNDTQRLKKIISDLKADIKKKDKKIDRLLSDIRTLQAALDKSIIYINEELANIPVEDIIRYFKNKKKGKLDEVKGELDRLKEKWSCHKCEVGYLRLIVLDRRNGRKYFRMCVNCDNRTKLKSWHPDVEGVKE